MTSSSNSRSSCSSHDNNNNNNSLYSIHRRIKNSSSVGTPVTLGFLSGLSSISDLVSITQWWWNRPPPMEDSIPLRHTSTLCHICTAAALSITKKSRPKESTTYTTWTLPSWSCNSNNTSSQCNTSSKCDRIIILLPCWNLTRSIRRRVSPISLTAVKAYNQREEPTRRSDPLRASQRQRILHQKLVSSCRKETT